MRSRIVTVVGVIAIAIVTVTLPRGRSDARGEQDKPTDTKRDAGLKASKKKKGARTPESLAGAFFKAFKQRDPDKMLAMLASDEAGKQYLERRFRALHFASKESRDRKRKLFVSTYPRLKIENRKPIREWYAFFQEDGVELNSLILEGMAYRKKIDRRNNASFDEMYLFATIGNRKDVVYRIAVGEGALIDGRWQFIGRFASAVKQTVKSSGKKKGKPKGAP
jgi:hypothetical protein